MEHEDFLDSINPVLEQVPSMALNLHDSGEGIKCDEESYTEIDQNKAGEDEDTEDKNEEPIVPILITTAGLPLPSPLVLFQYRALPHSLHLLLPDNDINHY